MALPPEHMMGPSYDWQQRAAARMAHWDDCAEWEAELIDEYGFDRAVRAIRQHVTAVRSREALEAERLRNEAYRWSHGGVLPQGW